MVAFSSFPKLSLGTHFHETLFRRIPRSHTPTKIPTRQLFIRECPARAIALPIGTEGHAKRSFAEVRPQTEFGNEGEGTALAERSERCTGWLRMARGAVHSCTPNTPGLGCKVLST